MSVVRCLMLIMGSFEGQRSRRHRSSRIYKNVKEIASLMMNDCRLLDGMAAIRRSLKYSSESVFDGQSERTKSRAGRWDSLFRIRLFHPHGAHPSPPPGTQLVRNQFDGSRREKEGKDKRGREKRRKGLLCLSMTIAVADGHLIESID